MSDPYAGIAVVYGQGSPYSGQPVSPNQALYAGSAPQPQPNVAPGNADTNPQYDTPQSQGAPDTYHVDLSGRLNVPPNDPFSGHGSDPYAGIAGVDPNSNPSMSPAEDVDRSTVTGLEKGSAGILGLPGDIDNVWGSGVEGAATWLLRQFGAFTPQQIAAQNAAAKGAPENFAHENGVIDSADANAGAQAALGPYHVPQTETGRYAQGIAQMVPGVALGPGGLLAKGANAVAMGIGSESAGELTAGTPLEPWARILGGLAGGGIAGGVRSVAQAPLRLAGRAIGDATPEQINMATALMQNSPVPLTTAEALQQVTGGATGMGRLQHFWEHSIPGGDQARPFFAARPAAVQGAISDMADQIAPTTVNPSQLGLALQNSSKSLIDRAQGFRTQSVDPFYEQANPQQVDPNDMADLLQNISARMAADKTGILAGPLGDLRSKLTDDAATAAAQQQAAAAPEMVTIGGQQVRLDSLPPNVQALVKSQGAPAGAAPAAPPAPTSPAGSVDPNAAALDALRTGKIVKATAGPSLLEFISKNGGLNDDGGEVSAMDGDKWHLQVPFRRKLIQSNGGGLEDMAQKAYDAGYFPDVPAPTMDGSANMQPVSGDDLLASMRQELAGKPLYAQTSKNADLAARISDMQELADHLGLDPKTQSTPDMLKAISDAGYGSAEPAPGVATPPLGPPASPAAASAGAAPADPDDIRVPILDIENLDRTRKFVRDNTQAQIDRGRMTPEQGAALTGYLGQLDGIMEAASPEFVQGKQLYGSMSDRYVTPMQAGPVGKIAATSNIGAQTQALFPSQPPEGTAGETSMAMRQLSGDPTASIPLGGRYPDGFDPALGSALARQHFVNTANTATAHLTAGPNQWSGAAFAKALAGNPAQRDVLMANLDALPNGPRPQQMGDFLSAMQATGKRMPAGSLTAFNEEMRDKLGAAPAPVRSLSTILDPLEIGKHLDRAVGGMMYRSQLQKVGQIMMPQPGQEGAAFAKARAALPQNQMLGRLLSAAQPQQP